MGGRERLAQRDVGFDPEAVSIDDEDVLDRLQPEVQDWWVDEFGEYVPGNGGFFTPPQKEAIPLVDEGENTLVCAPTGSGKTQSSFCAIYNDLFGRATADDLENSVYCLYVSPLKSLANDIHRNLADPIDAITDKLAATGHDDVAVRHAIRHGDTSDSDRQAMLETTPHILNTTPETLAILLNSPKSRRSSRPSSTSSSTRSTPWRTTSAAPTWPSPWSGWRPWPRGRPRGSAARRPSNRCRGWRSSW